MIYMSFTCGSKVDSPHCPSHPDADRYILFPNGNYRSEKNRWKYGLRLQLSGTKKTHTALVVLYGNANNARNCLELFSRRHMLDSDVYVVEYPGYGINSHMQFGIRETEIHVTQALMHLGERYPVLNFLAESIGGAFALKALERVRAGTVILVNPFSSLCKLISEKTGVPEECIPDRLDNMRTLMRVFRNIKRLVIVSSVEDSIVDPEHHQRLYAKARTVVPSGMVRIPGDHNDWINSMDGVLAML